MTDSAPEKVLVLVDASSAAEGAARAAAGIAAGLAAPLTILGVAGRPDDDAGLETALAGAYEIARQKVPSVESIRATGDLFEVASRRTAETPTSLVVAGSGSRRAIGATVWRLVRELSPPVLVTPPGDFAPKRALFCTGGERFIEEGARFAARVAAALGVSVTVFHVSPDLPGMYGDRLREGEISPREFLASNSRLAKNVRRQIEIFRLAGAAAELRLAVGDVVRCVLDEVRRGQHDLLIVGSSPRRGAIQTYMLGDRTHEIVGTAGRPFLVLRSQAPGFWTEMWRSLKEGAAGAGSGEASSGGAGAPPSGGSPPPART
ncbi:MAG: universal stress protein [Thermoanaerobaculia bacterium]